MQPDHFMHSQSSVRDDYKSWNLGSRNGAVRDVSYAAATQRLEEMGLQSEAWLHELRTIVTQMDIILDCIPSVQVDAVPCKTQCWQSSSMPRAKTRRGGRLRASRQS